MIVSPNGSQMTQGQSVLIWGASGGIGAYAWQYVLNGGGTPVGVVSSEKRAEVLRAMGCEQSSTARPRATSSGTTTTPSRTRRSGCGSARRSASSSGRDVDIVFEHPGRSTMGASVFVAKRGGMIITCAATSGFMIEYDNRYLWMNLKTLKGCHFANYREAWEANRLVCEARIHPTLSKVFPLDQTGEAALQVHHNLVEGKLGVLCLAPEEGLGVTDEAHARAAHRPDHAVPPHGGLTEAERAKTMDMLLTEIDHVAIAVNDLEAAIEYYRDTFGCEVEHREVVETRRRRGGAAQGRRLLRPAAHADARRLDRRQVPRRQGRGSPPHRLPRRRLRAGARVGEGARPPGDRRGAPPRQPGHDRRVRAPEDRVRHPDRARPGVTCRAAMPVPIPSDADALQQPPDAAEARLIAGAVAGAIAPAGGLTSLQRVLIESLVESMTGFVVPVSARAADRPARDGGRDDAPQPPLP